MLFFIFFMVMEYFIRIMGIVDNFFDFRFYLMCIIMKLNYLCFVNDLMIFCKVKDSFLKRVMEVLDYFYFVIVLSVN